MNLNKMINLNLNKMINLNLNEMINLNLNKMINSIATSIHFYTPFRILTIYISIMSYLFPIIYVRNIYIRIN
jgi:hypothetical protein